MNYKYASFAILGTLFIAYMSSIPDSSLWGAGSLSEQIIFNLAHIPAYALLTFLWFKTFERRNIGRHFSRVYALILVGLILFAISDEIHQLFVPGRSASVMDVSLDVMGILLGLSIFRSFRMFNSFQEK